MDDRKVTLEVQKLHTKSYPEIQRIISEDKQDNDGIEGDADFDLYHDDVDWCEWN